MCKVLTRKEVENRGWDKAEIIVIPNSVTKIESFAFESCTSLIDVVIPEGVTEIGVHVFHDCTNLTNVVIPEGATRINERIFYDKYEEDDVF